MLNRTAVASQTPKVSLRAIPRVRRIRLRISSALISVTLAAVAAAQDSAPRAIDLNLPTLKGDRFARLSEYAKRRPQVVVFWRSDCTFCMSERPHLLALAKARPDWSFVGIALEKRHEATPTARDGEEIIPTLLLPDAAPAALRKLGNTSGAIPHIAVLRANRSLCAARTGIAQQESIESMLDRCTRT
jgi:thiol-disulfide isomerase/thioredoxin